MDEVGGALCGGETELYRVQNGAVAWCWKCREYRAFALVMVSAFDGWVVGWSYRCDRCNAVATDFFGEPRYNLEDGHDGA